MVTKQLQPYLDQAMEDADKRAQATREAVIAELCHLGLANMMDYIKVQSDGSAYTDLSGLTREQAAAIQEITVDEYVEGKGDAARPVRRTRIKLAEKRGPLELLARVFGMLHNEPQSVTNNILIASNLSDDQLAQIAIQTSQPATLPPPCPKIVDIEPAKVRESGGAGAETV